MTRAALVRILAVLDTRPATPRTRRVEAAVIRARVRAERLPFRA